VPKTAKELHDNAGRLIEDTPPAQPILISAGSQKVLSDEEIYAKRKNSVFILGKLFKKGDTPGDIRFDLTGTAFALTADGFCATNYHVLQNILRNNDPATDIDSVYFIITPDQKVYFIDEITAWSQNNDMAIFKVNTRGNQLTPIPFGNPACVGAATYCISHPVGYFYYFSKGIVARNVIIPPQQAAAGYNPAGKPPVRMEITAEYGIGSSGGPILDKYGNLIGVVSSTMPIGTNLKGAEDSTTVYHQQMVIRDVIPVIVLKELLAVSTLRTPLGKFLFLI
jgi:S1-C subfamily serine protease